MERHHQVDVNPGADNVEHEHAPVAVPDGGRPARLLDARVGAALLEPRGEQTANEELVAQRVVHRTEREAEVLAGVLLRLIAARAGGR